MERMAVLVNDTHHAQQVMAALLAPGAAPAHWVMVLCPPRLPRRIGRWLSATQRRRWQDDWSQALQARLATVLPTLAPEAPVDWVQATSPLSDLLRQQRLRLGAGLRVVDARRHPAGSVPEPLSGPASTTSAKRLALPVAVASALSMVLALTD